MALSKKRVELLGLSAPFDRAFGDALAAVSEQTPRGPLSLGQTIQLIAYIDANPDDLAIQQYHERDLLGIVAAASQASTLGDSLTLLVGLLEALAPKSLTSLHKSIVAELPGLIERLVTERTAEAWTWSDGALGALFIAATQGYLVDCHRTRVSSPSGRTQVVHRSGRALCSFACGCLSRCYITRRDRLVRAFRSGRGRDCV